MRNVLIFPLLALTFIAACRSATPTPTSEPQTAAAGELRAVRAVVEHRAREQDPLQEVDPPSTVPVEAAANIVIGPTGRAELTWESFLGAELLSGTDVLVSLAEPEDRRMMLDQAAGTSRYRIVGSEAADLTITAGWVETKVTDGSSDLIISFVPGDPSTVWVVPVRGSATVALVGEADSAVELTSGDAVGIPEEGPVPEPMQVDLSAVETWYSGVAADTVDTSIVPVAMMCESSSELVLRGEAADDAAEAGELAVGAGALLVRMDDTSEWVMIEPVGAASARGWVRATSLTCNAPLGAAKGMVAAEATALATGSPTVGAPPRTVIVVSATPLPLATPGTATPTATPVVGDAVIEFWADDEEIEAGECTDVHWRTANIDSVWYQGQGVTGEGSSEECPTTTTTYTLRVKKKDGSEESRSIRIEVEPAEAPQPSDTPLPEPATATDEPEPTDETTPVP